MDSSKWIKKRRETLGITQEQFAERLAQGGIEVTKAAISKWEVGRTPLPLQTPENRQAFATALELSIKELLICAGYEIDTQWSTQARLIATLFDQLSAHNQKAVFLLVTHLKGDEDAANETVDDSVLLDKFG